MSSLKERLGFKNIPIRNSIGQRDNHCEICGAKAHKADSRWYENPSLIDGKYPAHVCNKCAWKEELNLRREEEYEIWFSKEAKHEREKPALRDRDVSILDDYRAVPRYEGYFVRKNG